MGLEVALALVLTALPIAKTTTKPRAQVQTLVLTEVMRQRDPHFVALINRLRVGDDSNKNADFRALQKRIIGTYLDDTGCEQDVVPPLFSLWLQKPDSAAPLITHTNVMRDHWNLRGAKAFADVSGQELHYYYSRDYLKRKGGMGSRLPPAIQNAAWRAEVKKASDYSGALPLCIGMPVFLIENIAVELGLANSAPGFVRGINFETEDNRRYAISVDVEFPSYQDPHDNTNHIVQLGILKGNMTFKLNRDSGVYRKAIRHQLPIILAFAFTVHNSQSRSLNSAILDLASSNSQAMTYVMLSRVRYWDQLYILRPFALNQLFARPSEEKRVEDERLSLLAAQTEDSARDRLDWYYSLQLHL